MCWKKFIYKSCVILGLFSSIMLLSGCGQSDSSLAPTSERYAEEATETGVAIIEDKTETDETNEIPVNTRAEEVLYRSEDDIDLLRAIHRCISDGENIFLAYNESDIYVMPMGADKHSPANIDNPDGMKVCNVAGDTYGRIHLLMAGQNYEEWYIWRLDEDYRIEKVIDISAHFETKQIPMWFLIDKDGTYYLQWTLDRKGIIIDSEGAMQHKFTPESLGIKWIYEAAVGKDGRIYLVYRKEDDKIEIGELEVEGCAVKSEDSPLSFPGNETFSSMSAGTDTNLLLFSPNSGVWAYDNEKGLLENRVALVDIGFGSDMEYWPLTFLPDGRLLLMGKTVNKSSAEDAELLMKYIPVGR